jgi:hypothetical protein
MTKKKKKHKPTDKSPPTQLFGFKFEWKDAIEELQSESDRGAALMGAACLDKALLSVLEASLADGKAIAQKATRRAKYRHPYNRCHQRRSRLGRRRSPRTRLARLRAPVPVSPMKLRRVWPALVASFSA